MLSLLRRKNVAVLSLLRTAGLSKRACSHVNYLLVSIQSQITIRRQAWHLLLARAYRPCHSLGPSHVLVTPPYSDKRHLSTLVIKSKSDTKVYVQSILLSNT